MVQTDAVLEVSNGVLDLGVAAVVGLQFQGLSVPVGDEAVIAVGVEEGQLGTGRASPAIAPAFRVGKVRRGGDDVVVAHHFDDVLDRGWPTVILVGGDVALALKTIQSEPA